MQVLMSMAHVVFLLVTLAGATHAFCEAAETKCIISNEHSSKYSCSVTPGATVYIQMMKNASGHRVRFKKHLPTESVSVFSLKREEVTIQEPYKNRTEFFISNGTLKITHVEINDSGQYSIEIFNTNGVFVKNINVTLDVQESFLTKPVWILIAAAVSPVVIVLLVVLICCCVCHKMKRKKSGDCLQDKNLPLVPKDESSRPS